MPAWLMALWGLAWIILEGPLLYGIGVSSWTFQFGLLLTIYASLRIELVSAAWLVILWMLPIEWMSAGPSGLYGLGLVAVFFLGRFFQSTLDKRWSIAHTLITGAGVLLHHLILSGYILITRPSSPMLKAIFTTSLTAALIGALASYPLGHLTERVGRLFNSRQRQDGLWLDHK